MSKAAATARWTASTGAALAAIVVAALVAAPLVGAEPGGGGDDPGISLVGEDGLLFGGDHDSGEEEGEVDSGDAAADDEGSSDDEDDGRAADDGEESGDPDGKDGRRHRHGHDEGPGVAGRAMSRGEAGTYGLALRAGGEGEDARGRLFFGHRSDEGGEGFAGMVTCLSVGDDGVVQVSGIVRESRRHRHDEHGGQRAMGGMRHGDKGGKGDRGEGEKGEGDNAEAADDEQAFAVTILTKSEPQQFSLPRVGEAGSIAPCSGGESTTVAVSRGGFRARG